MPPGSPRPWILTASGVAFDLAAPDPQDVRPFVRVPPTPLRRRDVMGLRPRAARTAFLERLDELTRSGARR